MAAMLLDRDSMEVQVAQRDAANICHFFKLPPELLDMIYDFAYPKVEGISIITRQHWKMDETRRSMDGEASIPYPGDKVDQFLVCKAFFHAAIKIYIGNQYLDADDLQICVIGSEYNNSLLQKYVRHIGGQSMGGDYYIFAHRSWPSLKRLDIVLAPQSLTGAGSKYPWNQVLDDVDIEDTRIYHNLRGLRGLTELNVKAPVEEFGCFQDPVKQNMFQVNAVRLRELLLPLVTMPRQKGSERSYTFSPGLYYSPNKALSDYPAYKPDSPAPPTFTSPRNEPYYDLYPRPSQLFSSAPLEEGYGTTSPRYTPTYSRVSPPYGPAASAYGQGGSIPRYITTSPRLSQSYGPASSDQGYKITSPRRTPIFPRSSWMFEQALAAFAQERSSPRYTPTSTYPHHTADHEWPSPSPHRPPGETRMRETFGVYSPHYSSVSSPRAPVSPIFGRSIKEISPRSPWLESPDSAGPYGAVMNEEDHLFNALQAYSTRTTSEMEFKPAALKGSQDEVVKAFITDPAGFVAYVQELQQRVEEFESAKFGRD